jgi:hypothetical protein
MVGLLGALVAGTQAHAALPTASPQSVLAASSYAELLRPIPNALATLKALDAPEARVEEAQYYPYYYRPPPIAYYHHHHHHHHHRYYYHHHHHHHHHHGYERW